MLPITQKIKENDHLFEDELYWEVPEEQEEEAKIENKKTIEV